MRKILIVALALGMVAAFALSAVALKNPVAPGSITLEITGKGMVTFDHALHETSVNGCKSCHHFGVGNGECSGCHGVAPQVPALADALAKNCEKCHAAAPAPVPAPAASCSDYSDKDSCRADSDCRWSRWRNKCRDRR